MTTAQLTSLLRSATAPGRRLGLLALVALSVTLAWMLYTLVPLLLAPLSTPGAAPQAVPEATLVKNEAAAQQLLADASARVVARAPFGQVRVAERPAAAKASSPNKYAGPNIVGMVDQAVWFADGKRLKPGESAGESLTVVAVDAPWSAKLRWMGGEFTVPLFDRSPISLSQPMSVWLGPPPPPSIAAPTTRPATTPITPPAPGPGGPPPGGPGAPPIQLPPGTFPAGQTTIILPQGFTPFSSPAPQPIAPPPESPAPAVPPPSSDPQPEPSPPPEPPPEKP